MEPAIISTTNRIEMFVKLSKFDPMNWKKFVKTNLFMVEKFSICKNKFRREII